MKFTQLFKRPLNGRSRRVHSPTDGSRCALAPWASLPRGSVASEATWVGGRNIFTASGAVYGGGAAGAAQPADPPNPPGPPVPVYLAVRVMFMWPPHTFCVSLSTRTPLLDTRALDRVAVGPRAVPRPLSAVSPHRGSGIGSWRPSGACGRAEGGPQPPSPPNIVRAARRAVLRRIPRECSGCKQGRPAWSIVTSPVAARALFRRNRSGWVIAEVCTEGGKKSLLAIARAASSRDTGEQAW